MKRTAAIPGTSIALVALLSLAYLDAGAASAQDRPDPDRYTAVTQNMTPGDLEIRADVLHWSTDEQRAAVIAALGEEDPSKALTQLPTMGVVWRNGSAVGNSIKYAHREMAPDGTEVVTLITDKRIGGSSFTPWKANDGATDTLGYSVVEMRTNGDGTTSLAAEVRIDADSGLVSLDRGARAPLLHEVRKQPTPYWARE